MQKSLRSINCEIYLLNRLTSTPHERVISFSLSLLSLSTKLLTWKYFGDKKVFFISLVLANYDPTEDEYFRKNGHVTSNGEASGNNNLPITSQPSRMQRNISINR
jgi:hypothetical protein